MALGWHWPQVGDRVRGVRCIPYGPIVLLALVQLAPFKEATARGNYYGI